MAGPTRNRTRCLRLALGIALLALLPGCFGMRPALTPAMIRRDLDGVRRRYYVPSLGVAEISLDDIACYGPVGRDRTTDDRAVAAGSYYQLGSCTKAMTATALVKLMADGSFSWDTRLLDLFPELTATARPAYREVTIGDIASHQAGFPPAADMAAINRLRDYRGSVTDYLAEFLREEPRIRRGRFLYSNNGYAALGAVIERRSGRAYRQAMDDLLFKPLGVKALYGFPKDLGAEQPWGHTAAWGTAAPAREKDQFLPPALGPAGEVSLTIGDFARFVQLHLRGLAGRDDAGFTSGMIRQLHEVRIETGLPFVEAYAAGWVVERLNGETIHWHNGSAGNFLVSMAINPARRKGVVVVTNVGDSAGERVCQDVVEELLTGREKP